MRTARRFRARRPDFFIGAVENPFAPPYEFRPYRVAKKIVAGAQFIQTQLIYNVERFEEFMNRVVDWACTRRSPSWPASAPSVQSAWPSTCQKEVAGMDVPQAIVDKMRSLSKEDGEKYGIDLCCEIANKVRNIEGVRGLAHHGCLLARRCAQGGPEPGLFPAR